MRWSSSGGRGTRYCVVKIDGEVPWRGGYHPQVCCGGCSASGKGGRWRRGTVWHRAGGSQHDARTRLEYRQRCTSGVTAINHTSSSCPPYPSHRDAVARPSPHSAYDRPPFHPPCLPSLDSYSCSSVAPLHTHVPSCHPHPSSPHPCPSNPALPLPAARPALARHTGHPHPACPGHHTGPRRPAAAARHSGRGRGRGRPASDAQQSGPRPFQWHLRPRSRPDGSWAAGASPTLRPGSTRHPALRRATAQAHRAPRRSCPTGLRRPQPAGNPASAASVA